MSVSYLTNYFFPFLIISPHIQSLCLPTKLKYNSYDPQLGSPDILFNRHHVNMVQLLYDSVRNKVGCDTNKS